MANNSHLPGGYSPFIMLVDSYLITISQCDRSSIMARPLYSDAFFFDLFAAVLELFLDDESHTYQRSTGLINQVDNPQGCIAIGKEVVDEEHFIIRA